MKKKAPQTPEAVTEREHAVGDIYALQSERYQKWALYQIVQNDEEGLGLLALDWFEDSLPPARKLGGLKPLIVQRYSWRDRPDVFLVSKTALPQRYVRVGHTAPLFEGEIHSYSMRVPSSGDLDAEQEHKWRQLSKSVRDAYKSALYKPQHLEIDGEKHWNNTTSRFIEAHSAYDWHQLDVYPMLTDLKVSGQAEGLLEYCKERPLIHDLTWRESGATLLDFSETRLEELTVDITGVERIILGDGVEKLSLVGDHRFLQKLRVEQPGLQGRYCELELQELKSHPLPHYRLPLLRKLTLRCDECDLARLPRSYPRLESFTAFGNPGTVKNMTSLKALEQLRQLMLVEMFGFSAAELPRPQELPHLESIWLSSVPREAGQWMKQAYKHLPDLNIRKLRDEDWLRINADNPFRAWDGRDGISPKHAKRAFDAYKKLGTALQKLQPLDRPTKPLLALIEDFVTLFNKMEGKSRIETVEREEIGAVLRGLMQAFPSAVQEAAFETFDRVRDF